MTDGGRFPTDKRGTIPLNLPLPKGEVQKNTSRIASPSGFRRNGLAMTAFLSEKGGAAQNPPANRRRHGALGTAPETAGGRDMNEPFPHSTFGCSIAFGYIMVIDMHRNNS